MTAEHNPIIQARERPNSKSYAIKAMCSHCMGCTAEKIEPGFRDEVRNCTSAACPLWPHRPWRKRA